MQTAVCKNQLINMMKEPRRTGLDRGYVISGVLLECGLLGSLGYRGITTATLHYA